MNNVILFDDVFKENLLPFTYTRPQAEIRIGILTIREKWEKRLDIKTSTLTESYLREKYPLHLEADNLFIAGSVCPTDELVEAVMQLQNGQTLCKGKTIIAHALDSLPEDLSTYTGKKIEFKGDLFILTQLCDIFVHNGSELQSDFDFLTRGRNSQDLSNTNILIGNKENLFIEEGAVIEASVLNVTQGKIYIGAHAEVMEGCLVRGCFSLGEHSQLKLGAKIYGPTTIGPHCKVGGEINNVVFFGYSNKAHDGFMGNSVIGEWCNIGADTNTSNLKNDYNEVKLWDYKSKRFQKTGQQFCGLIMADHVKCGINVMFNTGTVVGVGSNLFGAGYMPNFVASFQWGGPGGFQDARLDKIICIAEKAFKRRNLEFDKKEKDVLLGVYNYANKQKEPHFPNFHII